MTSKSKRKFRIWDNKFLFQTLQQSIQLKNKIEERCNDKDFTRIEDLPMSVIPTSTVYNIVACYEAMYEKLLEEDLLVAGYPKSNKQYH